MRFSFDRDPSQGRLLFPITEMSKPTRTPHNPDDPESGTRKAGRKALIRFHVWRDGPVSRGWLADHLSLNLPTVSHCVGELLSSGDLVEEGYANSTGGRKPQLLDINPQRGAVVGLTFSSRGISSAWSDFKGTLHNHRIYGFNPADGRSAALDTLQQAVRDQIKAHAATPGAGPIRQIGVGVSGLVNQATGVSRLFPRFEEWSDVPLREIIQREFQIPTVLDSHIAAIALAENIFGKYKGFENALYVQLGPGLGLGIIIYGQIYRGSKSNVGEFGHTTVTEGGPICYCGNYGCLESVASDYALVQQAEAAMKEGVNTRILEFAPSPGKVTPGAVFRAAAEGDRLALNLVEKVGRLLGAGIGNLVNLFGPEIIIIGGTMAEAGDLLLNPICTTLTHKALDRMERGAEVRTSSFGTEEAIKGAVTLALHHYLAAELPESRRGIRSPVAAAVS